MTNFLIIMSDQHNRSVMGCAGDPYVRTPNLDRLAAEGMLFSNCYTASPLCVPGRTAFLTSRYPSGTRVWTNAHILGSGIATWAHGLGASGYETALIGRMHFEGPDQRHGFEKRPFGEPFAIHPGAKISDRVWAPGIPRTSGQGRNSSATSGRGKGPYEIFDETCTDHVCRFLMNRKPGRQDQRPFAAVVGYLLPHCPFIGDPAAFDYYYDILPEAVVTPEFLGNLPDGVRRYLKARKMDTPLTAHEVRSSQAAYYAMVESMDRQIGRVLDKLSETGLAENTMVLYVSDHGEMMNDHGCWTKSTYYEGSVGVPMIARMPGVVPPGSTCSCVTNLVDIGPTLLDLAGAPSLPNADGCSMVSLLRSGSEETWDNATFSELYDKVTDTGSCMLRKDQWKVWEYGSDAPPVMFNLQDDPEEMNDLALDPAYAAKLDELLGELRSRCDVNFIQQEANRLYDDYVFLAKWGSVVKPELLDTVSVDLAAQSFERVKRVLPSP